MSPGVDAAQASCPAPTFQPCEFGHQHDHCPLSPLAGFRHKPRLQDTLCVRVTPTLPAFFSANFAERRRLLSTFTELERGPSHPARHPGFSTRKALDLGGFA